MDYSITEHKHRFAAWAAGSAASVIGCRFKVEDGEKIIKESGLMNVAMNIDNLPDPREFDLSHREWRKNAIQIAKTLNLSFTHGVAAKLINIYLKSVYVCGKIIHIQKLKQFIHLSIVYCLMHSINKI
jgi:hypothetical protein